jgi:pimeloyl-ACP methyl ester carboxylesterase
MYDQLSTSGTMKIFMDIYISFVQLAILILYGQFPIKAAPLKSMPKLSPRPVLIAHGNTDSQISVKHARFLKSVGGANAHLWVAEGKGHCIFTGDATGEENKEYRRQMMDFISRIKRKKKRKSRE